MVAGLPFFMVTGWGFRISRLVRHLRQYASILMFSPFFALPRGTLPPAGLGCLWTRPQIH